MLHTNWKDSIALDAQIEEAFIAPLEPSSQIPETYVEVKVVCGALNYSDLNTVYAGFLGSRGRKYEIFGSEIAGWVTQVQNSEELKIGDRVVTFLQSRCGACSRCTRPPFAGCLQMISKPKAAFQERIWLPVNSLRVIAPGITMLQAVSFSFSGTIAAQVVEKAVAEMNSTQNVLVTGANGAVGTYLTQIASRRGAVVANVVRSESLINKCIENGAKAAIAIDSGADSRLLQKLARMTAGKWGFDVVIDLAADVYLHHCVDLIRSGGRYFIVGIGGAELPGSAPYWRTLVEREIEIHGYRFRDDLAQYRSAQELIVNKSVSTVVDSIFPKDRIREACTRAWWSANRFGKVVVTFDDETITAPQ